MSGFHFRDFLHTDVAVGGTQFEESGFAGEVGSVDYFAGREGFEGELRGGGGVLIIGGCLTKDGLAG